MSRVVELFAFAVIVTGRIWLDVLSWKEIALFRLLAVRWGFLVSVEVCSDETFEKYAESPGPTIVYLVNFLSNKLFRFGRQRDHHFAHGISRLPEIAPGRFMLIPCGRILSAKNKSEKSRFDATNTHSPTRRHPVADRGPREKANPRESS